MILGNESVDQVDSLNCLDIVISKDGGCTGDDKSRIVKAQDWKQLKNNLEEKDKSANQD